ncbi:MAG TPA: flagellar filament capping protein FliD [Rhodocyclaceae bacterium]|nr:flagellar filament capping protein FliD [Rhodocyclaceae bacterium]
MAVSATNLDINSIVTQLMTIERQPLTELDLKEASYQAKISAYGTIKGALSSLQSAVQTLAQPNTFKTLGITSTDLSAVSGSATTSASPGTYNITVDQIAKANSVRSNDAYTSSSDTFNTGTLSIKVGSGSPIDITIDATNNSLSGIRNAINNANAGVSASIVNDGTNQRLVLTSKTLGSNGAISVTATDSGSGGTFALSGLDSTSLVQLQAADDAKFSVNGLAVTRSTNSVSDVVTGLTLNLGKAGSSTITVSKDNSTAVNAITAFVTAYNAVVSQNSSLTAYDAATKTDSILTGDSTVRSIQDKLAGLIGASVSNVAGGLSHLSDVGLSLQKDGTLALDTAKLSLALNDSTKDVGSLFTQTTTGNTGIAVQFNTWLTSATGSTGIIANRVDGMNASIGDLEDQRDALTSRLTLIEARYRSQYSALDALISNMNSTSTYLEQQLAALPGASSSK